MSDTPNRCEPPEEWRDKAWWHLINPPWNKPVLAQWVPHLSVWEDCGGRSSVDGLTSAGWIYIAPVITPAEIAEREAAAYQRGQREMRQGAAQEAQMFSDGLHRIHPDVAWDHMSEEAKSIGHAVAQNIAAGIAALPIKEKPE